MWLLVAVLFFFAVPALADEVTLSFVGTTTLMNVMASAAGVAMTGAQNVVVSDTKLGQHFTFTDEAFINSGPATEFNFTAPLLVATYTPGGSMSVLIENSVTHAILIEGIMQNSKLLATVPGAGAFGGAFTVTEVSPTILALFGLTGWSPKGSASFTFSNDEFSNGTLQATLGGGAVTFISAPAAPPVPELGTLFLFGSGLLLLGRRMRRQIMS
jgi:hypothetical protein